ncbi:MAG: SDR family oxidoreductase [Candidatus Omnitrophica bacterium]|nr:SDR family oxidoreductase [Candidatus Omnitrophota bacterium]
MSRGARALITGGTGLLGHALREAAPEGWEVFGTFCRNTPPPEWRARCRSLDVRDEPAVERLMDAVRPQVVIHTASIGSVDEAERDPQGVRAVNVGGTQAMGRACARWNARLVFISSNAVFDGRHPPYDEEAPLGAANRYGAMKIEAERWIRQSGPPGALIIRPILMYGWPLPGGRDNAVTRWLRELEAGWPVEVAEDVTSMPLYVGDCAQAIWAAVGQGRNGTYHVAGADRLSLAAFAQATARVFGADERLVVPVLRARFSALAPRPTDTSFVTTKMERELGIRPMGVEEGLGLMQRLRAAVP